MSNISVLKNIPEIMGQPAGIAVLASLGIHGAIALILPLVPVNTSKSEKQETTSQAVGITTLTPQEQARLPQTAIANPQQTKATPMQPQPGVASQLPPMPDFAAANATASPLPPLPAFPTNSQSLPPLPKATSVNVPTFPRGQRVATGGFNIDTGFRANPLSRRNYRAMAGNPRIGDVVGSQIPAGTPVNVSNIPGESNIPGSPRVADPPLSSPLPEGVPEGMAPQNGNVNNNPVVVNNDGREFVTPTGEPLQAGGEFSLANRQIPGVTPLPDNSLTQKIATVLENNQNQQQQQHSATGNTGDSSDGNPGNTRVSKALLMAQHYQQAQKNHGQLQTKQPLNLTLDRDGLKDVVDVGLVVKPDGTIDDFKVFTSDGKQLSFEQSNTIRQFLADYLRKNPPNNTGKPIYLTANIAPGNTAEKPAANRNEVTIPTKPLTVNNDDNNNTEQKPTRSLEVIRPNTNNPSSNSNSATEQKPIRSLEVIRSNTNNPHPVEVAPVQPTTPTTTKPQLEAEPSFSEPVRLRTPRPVTIPTQQPSRNPLLETTPRSINQINQPSGESQKPTRIQSWRERLTPQNNNVDDDRNENPNQSRGIQKLRELAEIKNQSNP